MSKRGRDKEEQDRHMVFNTSKKVLRSPEQRKRDETSNKQINSAAVVEKNESSSSMEELRRLMQTMLEKMDENTKKLQQEIRDMKLEMEKKEETWRREKEILSDRIEQLERKSEMEEKIKKKNNIVVKGLQCNQEPEEEIKKLFEEQLKVKADTNKVIILNKGKRNEVLIVEMENWEKKQEIMAAKSKLKQTKIYIDNDLTWEERKIQREIRSIAKEEKGKGKSVKIGYQKLIINGEVYGWNKQENGIIMKGKEEDKKGPKND